MTTPPRFQLTPLEFPKEPPASEARKITRKIISVLRIEMPDLDFDLETREKIEKNMGQIMARTPLVCINGNSLPRVDSGSFSPCTTSPQTSTEEANRAMEMAKYMVSMLELHDLKGLSSREKKDLKGLALGIIKRPKPD